MVIDVAKGKFACFGWAMHSRQCLSAERVKFTRQLIRENDWRSMRDFVCDSVAGECPVLLREFASL